MGRGKNLTEGEKAIIIKEIAQIKTNKSIDERIIRHVVTVGRFLKNPSRRKPRFDHGDLKSVSKRHMNLLKRSARIECLEKQVKDSLKNLGCQKKAKTTAKRVLVSMALIKSIIK